MKDPDSQAAFRRANPGPLRGCMKNRESVVSPLSLRGGGNERP